MLALILPRIPQDCPHAVCSRIFYTCAHKTSSVQCSQTAEKPTSSVDAIANYCPAACSRGILLLVVAPWRRNGDAAGFAPGCVNARCVSVSVSRSMSAAVLIKPIDMS